MAMNEIKFNSMIGNLYQDRKDGISIHKVCEKYKISLGTYYRYMHRYVKENNISKEEKIPRATTEKPLIEKPANDENAKLKIAVGKLAESLTILADLVMSK
jgi:transposase